MRFCITTLGCKVNQYESQAIARMLTMRGHERVAPGERCDICVINTCAVTTESARKSRQAIHRMKKTEPDALVAVCGCLSQLDPELIAAYGVDLVGGSGERKKFTIEVEQLCSGSVAKESPERPDQHKIITDDPTLRTECEDLPTAADLPLVRSIDPFSRTRALLKIQDGCDNNCTYCVIPLARGRARSLPVILAADHARKLAESGYREIVVTGIEISSYGNDLVGKQTLADAVCAIGAAASGTRIRLGSLDPCIVTEAFCEKLSSVPNLCDHFHLSLQSGCDDTLRRMGRTYSTYQVLESISSIRRLFPLCGITADLITGFPGESGTEFNETLRFMKNAAFSGMHVFPFSPRPGTIAATMSGQIDKKVRQERARSAASVAVEMANSFRHSLVGETVEVLFERKREAAWIGHSSNYIEVAVECGGKRRDLKNSISNVKITDVENGLAWGRV